jgi:hypothetical protein
MAKKSIESLEKDRMEIMSALEDSDTPQEAKDGLKEALANIDEQIKSASTSTAKATAIKKRVRKKGTPNPTYAKIQQIAKELKAKNPNLKHTEAVKDAWAVLRSEKGSPAPKKEEAKAPESKPVERKKIDRLKVTAKAKETAKKAVVKKATEAPKKESEAVKKAKRLKAKVSRVGKTYSYKVKGEMKTFTRDKDKDGNRTAMHVGKRVSKDGNVYYEYRDNRADTNIGKPSYKRPNMFARGGGIPKSYTHFVVRKSDGKIINGYDYKGVDAGDIKYFTSEDFKDMGISNKEFSLLTKQSLMSKGIDPFNASNWTNQYAKGGVLSKSDLEDFNEWMEDGNVIKNPDGTYSTQDANFRNRIESLEDLKKYYKREFVGSYAKGGSTDSGVTVEVRSTNSSNTLLMEKSFDTIAKAKAFANKINNELSDSPRIDILGYDAKGKMVVEFYDFGSLDESDIEAGMEFYKPVSWKLKMVAFNKKTFANSTIFTFSGSFKECEKLFNLIDMEGVEAVIKGGSYADGGEMEDYDPITNARMIGRDSQDYETMLKEYAGQHYKSLTRMEREQIIEDMKRDFDRRNQFAKGGRTDVNKDVTSTLSRLQPYLDEYTMRKYGFKANPEEIFVEYSKRPDGSAQITAVTIDSPSRKQSKKIFVDDIFETYARGGKMPKPYPMKEEIIIS